MDEKPYIVYVRLFDQHGNMNGEECIEEELKRKKLLPDQYEVVGFFTSQSRTSDNCICVLQRRHRPR